MTCSLSNNSLQPSMAKALPEGALRPSSGHSLPVSQEQPHPPSDTEGNPATTSIQ